MVSIGYELTLSPNREHSCKASFVYDEQCPVTVFKYDDNKDIYVRLYNNDTKNNNHEDSIYQIDDGSNQSVSL